MSFSLNLVFWKNASRKKSPSKIKSDRWAAAKPTTGGVAIFLTLIIGGIIFLFLTTTPISTWTYRLIFATFIAFAMGYYDDTSSVRPFYKLIFQLVCAMLVVDETHAFTFFEDLTFLNQIISIIWVVGLMNALNMLDNMDAVSAGVGGIISFGLGILSFLVIGEWTFIPLMLITLGCTMFGFLLLNWHPSKVYMGDSGSMALGLVLAAGSLHVVGLQSQAPTYIKVISLVLFFAIPLLDTTLVTLSRLRSKQSPARGGKDHSTHQLVYLGIKERSVATIFLALCATLTISAVYLLATPSLHTYTCFWLAVIYMIIHFISLWWISRRNLKKDKYSYSP
jgi:UDP-GlcNAc:undecaprenyl-phosphate/decaprenyl-phosphate GlcNAc-1-phosphate transferase